MRSPVVLAAAVAVALLAAACGDSHSSNIAWCRTVKQHNRVFDVRKPLDSRALAAFQQIAAQAPPAVRADVLKVRNDAAHLYVGDPQYFKGKTLTEWFAAVNRVDAYLEKECGVSIPNKNGSE